jgi:hypothetical protein
LTLTVEPMPTVRVWGTFSHETYPRQESAPPEKPKFVLAWTSSGESIAEYLSARVPTGDNAEKILC